MRLVSHLRSQRSRHKAYTDNTSPPSGQGSARRPNGDCTGGQGAKGRSGNLLAAETIPHLRTVRGAAGSPRVGYRSVRVIIVPRADCPAAILDLHCRKIVLIKEV
jgi:hypothetical protein